MMAEATFTAENMKHINTSMSPPMHHALYPTARYTVASVDAHFDPAAVPLTMAAPTGTVQVQVKFLPNQFWNRLISPFFTHTAGLASCNEIGMPFQE